MEVKRERERVLSFFCVKNRMNFLPHKNLDWQIYCLHSYSKTGHQHQPNKNPTQQLLLGYGFTPPKSKLKLNQLTKLPSHRIYLFLFYSTARQFLNKVKIH
jgi:hypothetical protein